MAEPNGVIAILTDFGVKDNYVGVMKGVILAINREATLVDITNEISPQNIRAAAFQLYTSYKYFPKGTVFLCVVDPGVGTERKAIAVETKNYFFVAPDNGLVYPTIVEDGVKRIVVLENKRYFLESISTTFHGRDIFAPIVAWISLGTSLVEFGKEIALDSLVKLVLDKYIVDEDKLVGEVNYIDRFGNVITSIPNKEYDTLSQKLYIITHKKFSAKKALTYGEGKEDELLVIEGSHGFIEVAVNRQNASKKLGIKEGEKIIIEKDFSP